MKVYCNSCSSVARIIPANFQIFKASLPGKSMSQIDVEFQVVDSMGTVEI